MRSRPLYGRTAIVSGGAQGIGAATVKRLVTEGCRVLVLDKEHQPAEDLIAQLHEDGNADAYFAHVDVCNRDAIAAAFNNIPSSWDVPSLLVHCAAGFVFRGVDAQVEDWHAAMDPTLAGLAFIIDEFVKHLPETEADAAIVTMASISAHIAQPGSLTYNTSKAAVLGFTRCLALDLAPRGIRVNSISPGTVWTQSNERFHQSKLGLDRKQAESSEEHGGKFLLQRFADPEEIAGPIVFLLSPDASFINGTDLVVDGGYLAI